MRTLTFFNTLSSRQPNDVERGRSTYALIGETNETFPLGGSTITISSNQNAVGSPIVWAIAHDGKHPAEKNSPHVLTLFAYSLSDFIPPKGSTTIAKPAPLVVLPVGPWGSTRAFIEPTVINGKVYAAWDTFPKLSDFIKSGALGTYWVRAFGFASGHGGLGGPPPSGG